MSIYSLRHRMKPVNGFLESLIDPIDQLSETIFSIMILLTFMLAYWILRVPGAPHQPLAQENVNELLITALIAVVAWGLIDGIMYALLSVFGRGESQRLLKDIQAARSEPEAVELIAADMDYLLEPITREEERSVIYRTILIHLQKSEPRHIGLKMEDISGILGHVLVAVIAVLPSLLPFLILRHDYELALRASILISFVVLFIAGFRWGKYTGANPWKTGLVLLSVAFALVLVATLLGG